MQRYNGMWIIIIIITFIIIITIINYYYYNLLDCGNVSLQLFIGPLLNDTILVVSVFILCVYFILSTSKYIQSH